MKEIGIPSLAVFESTLQELEMHRRIQLSVGQGSAVEGGSPC